MWAYVSFRKDEILADVKHDEDGCRVLNNKIFGPTDNQVDQSDDTCEATLSKG